jgi:nicotinamide mononucleotide (NMN) deamidase PncC
VKSVQSALADIDGVSDLKVSVGKVTYSGSAKAEDVIAALTSKTKFTAVAE